jgi:hypothetical protein
MTLESPSLSALKKRKKKKKKHDDARVSFTFGPEKKTKQKRKNSMMTLECPSLSGNIYICIRQHTSAYVSIRQHTSAYVSCTIVMP